MVWMVTGTDVKEIGVRMPRVWGFWSVTSVVHLYPVFLLLSCVCFYRGRAFCFLPRVNRNDTKTVPWQ